MEIEINCETINNSDFCANHIKQVINFIVNEEHFKGICDKIEKIIISEDIVTDVTNFQQELNIRPHITNSKFGKAEGKTIFNKKTQKYRIYLDANLGLCLTDDLIAEKCSTIPDFTHRRKLAFYVLHHELSHVIELSFYTDTKFTKNKFEFMMKDIIKTMFDEFIASSYCKSEFSDYFFNNMQLDIMGIENEILTEKHAYNNHLLDLNNFVYNFHLKTNMILCHWARIIGNYYDELETLDLSTHEKEFVIEFKKELTKLENYVLKNKKIRYNSSFKNLIKKYFKYFNIEILQTKKGLYYDIPFNSYY